MKDIKKCNNVFHLVSRKSSVLQDSVSKTLREKPKIPNYKHYHLCSEVKPTTTQTCFPNKHTIPGLQLVSAFTTWSSPCTFLVSVSVTSLCSWRCFYSVSQEDRIVEGTIALVPAQSSGKTRVPADLHTPVFSNDRHMNTAKCIIHRVNDNPRTARLLHIQV